jgi:SAM-dependent methyltransferase
MTPSSSSPSARKAAMLYDRPYAERYRAHDESLAESVPYQGFVAWLQRVCARFTRPIDALDLGCGTGRYFSALPCARTIIGIDASAEMLDMARTPISRDRIAATVTLVHGDLFTHPFDAGSFDLVYSIGVLAEHAPLDAVIVDRVHRLLKAGGRFAFSTVHPESPSIGKTKARTVGQWLEPFTFGPPRRWLRERLAAGGMYADERWIAALLPPRFVIESLERFVSEAHLHCLCVARKETSS